MRRDTNAATASKSEPRLRRKVPAPLVAMAFDARTFFYRFGLGFAALSIFGPLVGHPDHNGYRYLCAPLICPFAAVLYYIAIPFNPYRGMWARRCGMELKDLVDPERARLVMLFRSGVARRLLFRSALKVCGILFAIMVVFTLIFWHSLVWRFPTAWLGLGLFGCCMGAWMAIGIEYIHWGIASWESQAAAKGASPQGPV